jgi:hypothetical protein
MATLTDDEMMRIRAELGTHLLSNTAEPLIGTSPLWAVIRDNVTSSTVSPTTSATTVSAVGPTTLTLASVTGYTAGQAIQIDCDAERETCTIRNVSGLTVSVICRKLHSGTYPVEVESPLTIVRGILSDLRRLEQGDVLAAFDTLGLKRVDEIEFSDAGRMRFIERAQSTLRGRLASACGVASASTHSSNMEPY